MSPGYGGKREKVGSKRGLKSMVRPYMTVLSTQKAQIVIYDERDHWKENWNDQRLYSRWKANSLHHH